MAVVALVALAAEETLVGGVARVALAAREASCHCCWMEVTLPPSSR